jgi:hypothetical protein
MLQLVMECHQVKGVKSQSLTAHQLFTASYQQAELLWPFKSLHGLLVAYRATAPRYIHVTEAGHLSTFYPVCYTSTRVMPESFSTTPLTH